MRNLVISSLSLICFLSSACFNPGKRVKGNGNVESETRVVNRANKIKVSGSMNIIVDSGATAIRVEAEENILPYIITTVHDNWLEIRTRKNVRISTTRPMTVYVTTPYVTAVRIDGSGNITSENKMWSKDPISINIGGSGDVRMLVNTPKIDADIAGSGNVTIAGETRDVDVSIAGSGNFEGKDLKAENAKVKIAGSGDATVFADVKLNASIVGSGNVSYIGHADVERKIAGSGKVRRVE